MHVFSYTIPRKGFRAPEKVTLHVVFTHNGTRAEWELRDNENQTAGVGDLVVFDKKERDAWCVIGAELEPAYAGKGIYPDFILPTLRKLLGPIYSDRIRTDKADKAWAKVKGAKKVESATGKNGYRWKINPLYRTGRHLLFTNELPEGRSNKVRYFLKGHEKPWQGGRGGFGPEWQEVLRKSGLQARAFLAQRNPRQKTMAVRLKVGGKTIEVRLIRSNPGHADVLSYFHPDCQKEALEPPRYKSRDKVIKMSPAAFLDMAMPLFKPVESKMQNLRELVAKGVQIRDLPTLIVDRDGYVKGHEGRHRAMLLESLGFKEIPVVLSSANIRWSEQGDPSNRFDYIEKWPLWLVSEDESRSIRFPVKRSDAAKSAWSDSV